jgi:hypothetical protein
MKTKKMISVGLITAGLVLSSVGAVNADSITPRPTPTSAAQYVQMLAAYQDALVQFKVTLVVNTINYRIALEKYEADWQAALAKYEAPYKATLAQYQTLRAAYDAKLPAMVVARKSAQDKADTDFLTAIASATTSVQKNAALVAYTAAYSAANAAYKIAAKAVSPKPVKPHKPAELTKPPRPVKPTLPVAPQKPAKYKK